MAKRTAMLKPWSLEHVTWADTTVLCGDVLFPLGETSTRLKVDHDGRQARGRSTATAPTRERWLWLRRGEEWEESVQGQPVAVEPYDDAPWALA